MSQFFRANLLAAVAVLVVPLAMALSLVTPGFIAPALADGSPVNVNASVTSTLSLTGLAASVSFPGVAAGSTSHLTPAETYQVVTDNPTGYTLTVAAGANSFSGPGSLDNSNWLIHETASALQTFMPSTSGRTIATTHAATNGDNYSENWDLSIPGGTPPGAYSNSLTYLVIGN